MKHASKRIQLIMLGPGVERIASRSEAMRNNTNQSSLKEKKKEKKTATTNQSRPW
jgi:hypothetical protein